MSNSSIWPIDRTHQVLPLRAKVDLGAMEMKGDSTFPKVSPSDFLVPYLGHSLRKSYPSAEMQSVYSANPADWAIDWIYIRTVCLLSHWFYMPFLRKNFIPFALWKEALPFLTNYFITTKPIFYQWNENIIQDFNTLICIDMEPECSACKEKCFASYFLLVYLLLLKNRVNTLGELHQQISEYQVKLYKGQLKQFTKY